MMFESGEEYYLTPAFVCELYPVIRNELVDLAVLVAFALGVADQDDHLQGRCQCWL